MGKHFSPEIYKLSERPAWRDFDRLRKELDPNGLFENQFVKRLFADAARHMFSRGCGSWFWFTWSPYGLDWNCCGQF